MCTCVCVYVCVCVHARACVYVLCTAKHPDVQEKAYEEIAKMMDAEDGRPDFDAVNSLTYLSQVIKETQRLHPILPFLSRDATKDTTIGGKHVCMWCKFVYICWCFSKYGGFCSKRIDHIHCH